IEDVKPGAAVGRDVLRADVRCQLIRLARDHGNELIDGLVGLVPLDREIQAQATVALMSARVSKIKRQEGRLGGMPVKACVQRVLLEATVKYQIAGVLSRRLLHGSQALEVFPDGQ